MSETAITQAVGFWLRGLARLLDTAFLFAVDVGLKAALGVVFGLAPAPRSVGAASVAMAWTISAIGTTAYYVMFELLAGTTIGKLLVGAQVVDLDLGAIRLNQAVKRSLAFFVDALFFGMIAASVMSDSPLKQRIGDQWAKTRVVRRRALLPPLRTPLPRIVVAGIVSLSLSLASTVILEYLKRRA